MTKDFDWTPEKIKLLIALWGEGVPSSEIGRRIGTTKNAVVGKVHRLGLKKRESPIAQTAAVLKFSKPKKAPDSKPAAPAAALSPSSSSTSSAEEKSKWVPLGELPNGGCPWPKDNEDLDGPDYLFCGKKIPDDQHYCDDHQSLAYPKWRPKAKVAAE